VWYNGGVDIIKINNIFMDITKTRTRCEVWLRTMGYYRPLSQMNTGKKAEVCSRKNFSVIKSNNSKFIEDNK